MAVSEHERHPEAEAEAAERPKLVFFHSARSGRCRRAEGFLAQVLQRRRNHETFRLRRLDVDARPDIAERLHVKTLPTLLLIEDKVVRGRLEDPRGCREITDFLDPWLR